MYKIVFKLQMLKRGNRVLASRYFDKDPTLTGLASNKKKEKVFGEKKAFFHHY